MTKPEQFTDDEWQQVAVLPGLVIMASSLSDGKIVPSVRELSAGAEALAEAGKAHPENAVLQAMLAADVKPSADEAKEAGVTNVAEVVEVLSGQIADGVAVLRAKVGTDEVAAIGSVLLADGEGRGRADRHRLHGLGRRQGERQRAVLRRPPRCDPRLTPAVDA